MLLDLSRHCSPSFEYASSFLQERVHAFLLVLGRKQEIEALTFHREAFRQRPLESLEHGLLRHVLAGGARPALGAAGARDDAEVDLGLTEPRRIAGDDQVTHERHLAAAAQRVAVDRSTSCSATRLAAGRLP